MEDEEEEEVFVDKWNYKNEPHNVPILPAIKRNHTLPKSTSNTVST